MRLAPLAVAALAIFAGYKLYSRREIAHAPGVLAAADPEQRDIESAAVIERGEFRLRPRAKFSATVRVLRREDYSMGPLAKLVPTDFAVGWGPMSDSAVLADVEISQGNRFYYWRTENWPIERADIETHSANWHVIPENSTVGERARPSASRQRGGIAWPARGHRRRGRRHAHLADARRHGRRRLRDTAGRVRKHHGAIGRETRT